LIQIGYSLLNNLPEAFRLPSGNAKEESMCFSSIQYHHQYLANLGILMKLGESQMMLTNGHSHALPCQFHGCGLPYPCHMQFATRQLRKPSATQNSASMNLKGA
jgi:hypothetical protein